MHGYPDHAPDLAVEKAGLWDGTDVLQAQSGEARRSQFLSLLLIFYTPKFKKKRGKTFITESCACGYTLACRDLGFTMAKLSLAKRFLSSDKVKQKCWKQRQCCEILFLPCDCFCIHCNCCTLVPSTACPVAVAAWASVSITRATGSKNAVWVGRTLQFSLDALTYKENK